MRVINRDKNATFKTIVTLSAIMFSLIYNRWPPCPGSYSYYGNNFKAGRPKGHGYGERENRVMG